MRARVLAGVAAVALAAACAPAASAAGTPVGGLRWLLAMDKRLPGRLTEGCVHTTVLAGLTVTYVTSSDNVPGTVVTGTLDGAPVTVAGDPDLPHNLSDDFVARVNAALGGGVELGTIGDIEPRFTATGPLT
jgi:hypothetical protein